MLPLAKNAMVPCNEGLQDLARFDGLCFHPVQDSTLRPAGTRYKVLEKGGSLDQKPCIGSQISSIPLQPLEI